MKREVKFLKGFATKKKGDTWECNSMLASHLVHEDKVAVYTPEQQVIIKKISDKAKAKNKSKK